MQEIEISSDELVKALLKISEKEQICLLDSCGVSHLDSKFLLVGIKPLEVFEISDENHEKTLQFLDEKLGYDKLFAFFTLSYDLGLKINRIPTRKKESSGFDEPDLFLALFDSVIIHDYDTEKTYLIGNENRFQTIINLIFNKENSFNSFAAFKSKVKSNFTKPEYLEKIEEIKEYIRKGDTYQTNLTQQITAELDGNLSPQQIFYNLRKNHPAPFASFIKRNETFVISASPERFFKVQNSLISTSPIKGTRPRGKNAKEDEILCNELLNSEKDRAENVMIVDLLRNDIGRICEFGSIKVEKLCELETHPTLFHLVSTINGILRKNIKFSDILRAVFPCGSITGAPKIRTMQIIDQLETVDRSLSMGAIGYKFPSYYNQTESKLGIWNLEIDISVAIRTMVINKNKAIFNVGGGIVIDSDSEDEFDETLVKAKALLEAIGGDFH